MRLKKLWIALSLTLILPACALCEATEIEIIVPDAYAQSGTLPVYAMTRRDFADVVQPEWFNESGVVKKVNLSKRGRYDCYTFTDEDELSVSGEKDGYIYYVGIEGERQIVYDDGTTQNVPAHERSADVENLAMDVYWGYADDPYDGMPLRDMLAHVTLADAQANVERMLDRLGIEGYECTWAFSMDTDTILALNAQRNERIASGRLSTTDVYDFAGLSVQDEGYALIYRARVDGVETSGNFMELRAFVNGHGLRVFSLSAPYALGEIVNMPDSLITLQEAIESMLGSVRKSRHGSEEDMGNVTRAELIYSLDPLAKGKKLQLLPAWRLCFPIPRADIEVFAYVSAVDGAVLDAPWK